ncbi:hypothetical protein G8A07_14355 [Roseateles sp. DAIF2]|uniref:hypothetical protein n=1 Tax=Roseateles sp. DAIF2 TaxID=2714952 RepID=UPI0018A30D12|nr:hypothetical protein [Roseateles sp. DAIF2]QPF73980.1 hypothetical protein G8A07_14355 [Roseateles sp. DAIF2]
MGSLPRFQSVDGGLMGCLPWMSPLEGAYTRTAKIALVNALDPRSLCELLFGSRLLQASFSPVHGRSFLSGLWAAPKAQGATGQSALPGFLTSLCGGWATVIAGDTRLRLCRACADVGFQSALHQIDALSTCPLHGEPLRDTCPHCDAPTPRYALTQEAFQSPMQCTECGRGYGRAWNGTANFEQWCGPGDTRALQQLGRRLQAWQSLDVDWSTVSNWVDIPSSDPSPRRRAHVFHALSTLASTGSDPDAGVTVMGTACLPSRKQPPRREPRTAIYESIRRHVIEHLDLSRCVDRFDFHDAFYLHRVNEAIVPKYSSCLAHLHALVLWISRCEGSFPFSDEIGKPTFDSEGDAERTRLGTSLLLWPTEVQVSDEAWGHFVWRSFLEDLWTARQWQAAVRPLGDPFEKDSDAPDVKANRATYLELLAIWAPRMSPRLEVVSSGLSHFTWREGVNQRQLCLVSTRRFEGAWYDEPRVS